MTCVNQSRAKFVGNVRFVNYRRAYTARFEAKIGSLLSGSWGHETLKGLYKTVGTGQLYDGFSDCE
jgi:hypothetical protein